MAPKANLLLYFAGTGITAKNIHYLEKNIPLDKNTVRVYFNGCQDPLIGGVKTPYVGRISPNLDVVAKNIKKAFSGKDKTISIGRLKKIFGDSIIIEPKDAVTVEQGLEYEVESIDMAGFSRGGVTTFACARHLNSLEIPMHIIAMDPVPGDSRWHTAKNSESEYAKNADLSKCDMLRSAQVTLGTYIKTHDPIQNKYFRQMVPKFNDAIANNVQVTYTPKKFHNEYSAIQSNIFLDFLSKQRLSAFSLAYSLDESSARTYSIPRILQQNLHSNRDNILATKVYKDYLSKKLNAVSPKYYSMDTSLKEAEASLSVYSRYKFNKIKAFKVINDCNTSNMSAAARDFLIEINAIMQLVAENACLQSTSNLTNYILSLGGLLGREEPIDQNIKKNYLNIINEFLQEADNCLLNFLKKEQRDMKSSEIFVAEINQKLELIKSKIPKKSFILAKKVISSYLNEAALLHPGLEQFLNEEETLASDSANMQLTSNTKTPARRMTMQLYNSSEKQRSIIYDKFRHDLPKILTNFEEIASVAQFLKPNEIQNILTNPDIIDKIKTYTDLSKLIKYMRTEEQRAAVLSNIDISNLIKPSQDVVTELLANLSDKQKSIVTPFIPTPKIKHQIAFFNDARQAQDSCTDTEPESDQSESHNNSPKSMGTP